MSSQAKYINRELSWLRFNDRVLSEADNADNPLLERAKFIAIVSNNLDEFFMVRVGSLAYLIDSGDRHKDPAGLTPEAQMEAVIHYAHKQADRQYAVLHGKILPALAGEGIYHEKPEELDNAQKAWIESYFSEQVLPVLTPYAINRKRPFPLLAARCIYLGVILPSENMKEERFALIAIPGGIPRVVMLPMGRGHVRFILLEELVAYCASRVFGGIRPISCQAFRITRNSDFMYEDNNAATLIMEMRKNLRHRKLGKVVRLEITAGFNDELLRYLMRSMQMREREVFALDAPLQPDFFMKPVYDLPGYERLRYAPFSPRINERLLYHESIFRTIRKGDIFLHHPYDSFDPVVRFVRESADDPRVLAIKQTLYRISGKSPIVSALLHAAQQGKQVTVLIEVRARFDEENNISWCLALEKAGCNVIYGVPKLKVHSKITYVIRREESGLRQYLHLSTGNYNDVTAKIYTDMSILTCDEHLGRDAGAFFHRLTGYSHTQDMNELITAPDILRSFFKKMVLREIDNASRGLPAGITAKMNSLVDVQAIDLLYKAADAGVSINLCIRGMCCLKTDGYKNIRVRSVVGRFLEHARVYIFENNGNREVYLSSADLMPRNLDRRIELFFPVKDPVIASTIAGIVLLELHDTVKSWKLVNNGKYARVDPRDPPVNSQEILIHQSMNFDNLIDTSGHGGL
jgi:polyphosphate kinase